MEGTPNTIDEEVSLYVDPEIIQLYKQDDITKSVKLVQDAEAVIEISRGVDGKLHLWVSDEWSNDDAAIFFWDHVAKWLPECKCELSD